MTIQNCSVTDNMKTDRILELAKPWKWYGNALGWTFNTPDELEAFYKLAHQDGQKQMRERAAKLCELIGDDWHDAGNSLARDAAKYVRSHIDRLEVE